MSVPVTTSVSSGVKPPLITTAIKQEVSILQKLEAFQNVIVFTALLTVYLVAGYFFYSNIANLKNAPVSFTVPLPQEIKTFESVSSSISFDGLDSLPKYIQNLKDSSITIVGGAKGRDNPFDTYATPRSSR